VAVVIEHFAGAFPVWLAPQQVVVIPVADGHNEYADKVVEHLKSSGIRAEADKGKSRMNKKIREQRQQRIPYMLIVGDKDIEAGTVSVRLRTDEDLGAMLLDDFVAMVKGLLESRSLELQ
jgi:threonyl-tRNA synthetase